MKFLSLLFCTILLTSFCKAQTDEEKSTVTHIGDNLPDFSFETSPSTTTSIDRYKGKLILINLFATWCPPCNTELPLMEKEIWQKHKDNPHFALFVFGREENWQKLNGFKSQKGFTFPILPDTAKTIFNKFATKYIPRNILIDKNGKIIYQSIGYSDEEFKKLEKLIDSQLEN